MKWFFIIIGVVGALFLVNAYVPSAWASGFNVPIGHGIMVPWALCILLTIVVVGAIKLKSA